MPRVWYVLPPTHRTFHSTDVTDTPLHADVDLPAITTSDIAAFLEAAEDRLGPRPGPLAPPSFI